MAQAKNSRSKRKSSKKGKETEKQYAPKRDLNTLIIGGRLVEDPIEWGETAAKLRIAVSTVQTVEGDRVEIPFFINVIVFDPAADNCLEYLFQGRKVEIVGGLGFDEYEARDEHGDVLFYDDAEEKPVIMRPACVLTDDVQFR